MLFWSFGHHLSQHLHRGASQSRYRKELSEESHSFSFDVVFPLQEFCSFVGELGCVHVCVCAHVCVLAHIQEPMHTHGLFIHAYLVLS